MIVTRYIPSPGALPTVTQSGQLFFTVEHTVAAGTILFNNSLGSFIQSENNPGFINNGEIWFAGPSAFNLLSASNVGQIVNNGLIVVSGLAGASGISAFGAFTTILNTGDIYVISEPTHVSTGGIGGSYEFLENTGNIYVEGGEYASGVGVGHSNGIGLINSGLILVAADIQATGIASSQSGTIINSGTVEAVALTQDGTSQAVRIFGSTTIENSGSLIGDIGIVITGPGALDLDNSGIVVGDIIGGNFGDVLLNSGDITGDIYLYTDDDVFDSTNGTTNGNVYGQYGNDQILFGAGDNVADGGAGDDFISGGAGNDLLIGGKGNDVLEGGLGNDGLSGGFGNDTFTLQGGDRALGFEQDDIFILTDNQFALADGGNGNDTIRLSVSGLKLNISAFIAGQHLGSIENVELLANTAVALTSADVASLSSNSSIIVTGGGELALYQSSWVDMGPASLDGQVYQLFQADGASIYVGLETTTSVGTSIPAGFSGPAMASGPLAPTIPVIQTNFLFDYLDSVVVHGDYIIYELESYRFEGGTATAGSQFGVDLQFGGLNGYTLTNHGTVESIGSGTSPTYTINVTRLGLVINTGQIYAESGGDGAFGILYDFEGSLLNSGDIETLSTDWKSVGVLTLYDSFVTNSGLIEAKLMISGSEEFYNEAIGVRATSNFTLNNTGIIRAESNSRAFGVQLLPLFEFSGVTTITNGGLIEAITGAGSDPSAGVRVEGAQTTTIDNTGTIRADMAINIDNTDYLELEQFSSLTLTNTGNIEGDIVLIGSHDHITNDGLIDGDISMGSSDDIYLSIGNGSLTGSLSLGAGNDFAQMGAGNDTVFGEGGNDLIEGGGGNDTLDGGSGVDMVSYSNAFTGVYIDLGISGQQNTLGAGFDTLTGFENINGSAFGDTLIGDDQTNILNGGGGNDSLAGGDGNDLLNGGAGNDDLNGGNGTDTISYLSDSTGVAVDLNISSQQDTLGSGLDTLTSIENITGSVFGDTLIGSASNNVLRGNDGDDVLRGNAGDDVLEGGDGIDRAEYALGTIDDYTIVENADGSFTVTANSGDEGSDTLKNVEYLRIAGVDHVLGRFFTDEADNFEGTPLDDTLSALAGDDIVSGLEGNDTIYGDEGNDLLHGNEGNDFLYGGSENDQLFGDQGADEIYGDSGDDIVYGGLGDDRLDGGAGADVIYGEDGSDILWGRNDDDILYGGAGSDALNGGPGNDYLYGNVGNDILRGNAGDDFIDGGAGNDEVYEQDGNDVIYLGDGDDLVWDNSGNDQIFGQAGNDMLNAGPGNDILDGGAGDDFLDGSDGIDTASYLTAPLAVVVDLALGQQNTNGAGVDTLTGIENLTGSEFDDVLYGNATGNTINGSNGNDIIFSRGGTDNIVGGLGNDRLDGGSGADILNGGAGADDVSYDTSLGGVIVNLTAGIGSISDAQGDTYISIENVIGSSFDDFIVGDLISNVLNGGIGDDAIEGRAGNDTLIGGAGADALDGGSGVDTASFVGSSGVIVNLFSGTGVGGHAQGDTYTDIENVLGSGLADYVVGSALGNELTGGAGNDSIEGRAGNDILIGGSGADSLNGGDGIDTTSYEGSTGGVIVNLIAGTGSISHAQGDTYTDIENVMGSSYNDYIVGSAGSNTLMGAGGDDTIEGRDGNDTLIGGAGADSLNGGANFDMVSYAGASSGVLASLFTGVGSGGDAAGDTYTDIEALQGSSHNDILVGRDGASDTLLGGQGSDGLRGNGGDDALFGQGGDDLLFSGFGADSHDGGTGTDTILYNQAGAGVIVNLTSGTGAIGQAAGDTYVNVENVIGTAFGDLIVGDAGANVLQGRGMRDVLEGRDGADTIIGGTGNDVLRGGTGNDLFVFDTGDGADRLEDFATGDKVDLTDYGFASFAALQALMYTSGSDVVIAFTASDAIRIVDTDINDLSASDFLLGSGAAKPHEAETTEDLSDLPALQQDLIAEFLATTAVQTPIYHTNTAGILEIMTEDDLGYDWDGFAAL